GTGSAKAAIVVSAAGSRQGIDTRCYIVKEIVFLGITEVRDDLLEGIPKHAIAAADLVRREIGFEHAAPGPEQLDRGEIIAPGGRHHFVAGWRDRPLVPAKTAIVIADPAQLDRNIVALSEALHALPPLLIDLFPLALILSDAGN